MTPAWAVSEFEERGVAPGSESQQVQSNCGCKLFLPGIRADELGSGQNFGGSAVQNVQRATADCSSMLLCQFHRLGEEVLPVACLRHKHPRFQVGFDQCAGCSDLCRGGAFKEHLQLQSIHKLQFVKRRVADGFALDESDNLGAVWLRIIEFD